MPKRNPKKKAPEFLEQQVHSLSQVRFMAILFVRQNTCIADHVKDLAEDAVRRHMSSLGQELGSLELAVRRTQQGGFTA